ncbi:RidA family protein [Subdoligranulum sp. AM23-21AC]|uniref:Rid family hydrolase n=1 Tax=Ruthenibacterium lactatiformans TaxID=1550024 RepID=UPI000E3F838E|nr:Rid family hydrolase [Ruthenibacterium lactatiformans]RGC96966.1 RidA family protein [Subdoligranulum sp. AM16-9]RGD16412.1 RidA family protein [Subdoligranulum sp. AM23-21AC]
MNISRYPASGTQAKAVIWNGTAYCAGLTAENSGTMAEQTADILAQYDRLFSEIGIHKEDIVMANTFLYDMNDGDAYGEVWKAWVGAENAPAGVCVQAVLPPEKKIIISLIATVRPGV